MQERSEYRVQSIVQYHTEFRVQGALALEYSGAQRKCFRVQYGTAPNTEYRERHSQIGCLPINNFQLAGRLTYSGSGIRIALLY